MDFLSNFLDLFKEVAWVLLFDAMLALVVAAVVVPLCILRPAAFALLKRNFVGYFSNPTGYVFLFVFVVLSSMAAFCPDEFFNANLATLTQLTHYFPLIMLVFIPAITMSIWSEERRQGTDELLLTIPATDYDIVSGKYLAAAAIFSVSLIFSQVTNVIVLASLARDPIHGIDLDARLLFTNYLGYWFAGLAMISLGMVGSFLTRNLTVAFIAGMLINAPIVLGGYLPNLTTKMWSIQQRIDDFSRGVISLSSVGYFLMVIAIGLYLSMVLIGKRHWSGGRDGSSMGLHYVGRTMALIVAAVSLSYFFTHRDFRRDLSEGQVGSLSRETKKIVQDLDPKYPIYIDCFISKEVPERYVKTKIDLVSNLKEIASAGKGKINVTIYENVEEFSEEAALAEERFEITPQTRFVQNRGKYEQSEILMGAAFRSGLQKVVIPFFDYGIPVEYELARTVATLATGEKKKLAVVRTEAGVMGGGFNMMRQQPTPRQAIIDELQKQYDVEDVSPSTSIDPDKYDVMMVVQPSSLSPTEFDNVLAAIRGGVPTAIFEDPRPHFLNVIGTGEPKMAGGGGMGGMFGGRGGPQPKANITRLWELLGIRSPGRSGGNELFQPAIVWQRHYPYPKLVAQGIPDEWVFIPPTGFNNDEEITSGLQEVLFPMPGAIEEASDTDTGLTFTPLVHTNDAAGRISYEDYMQSSGRPVDLKSKQGEPTGKQVIAARIQGRIKERKLMSDAGLALAMQDTKVADAAGENKEDGEEKPEINVIYVADVDVLDFRFLNIRSRPDEQMDINFKFENVTFLLNVIDALSGDDSYVQIRKRKARYSSLRAVEAKVEAARSDQEATRLRLQREADENKEQADKRRDEKIEEFRKTVQDLQSQENVSQAAINAAVYRLNLSEQYLARKSAVEVAQIEREFNRKMNDIQRDVELNINHMQDRYRLMVVLLPAIFPIALGILVFVWRRVRESEGANRARMR